MSKVIDTKRLPGNKRKARWQVMLLPLPMLLYIGYCGGLILEFPDNTKDLMEQAIYMFLHPFPISTSMPVFLGMSIGFALWLLIMTSYAGSINNRLPGEEYGSARFASPAEISRKYRDKDETKNKIYGECLRVCLDDKKSKRNNNTLVIGGAGSGKSFFFVRPNLMQCNASYVITDPKSELYRDMAPYLRRKGYKVKCLDLIEPEKSNHYNPFVYIRTSADIIRLVTNFIANTTPKNAATSDPFWEKSEIAFLSSLFLYVWMTEEYGGRRNLKSVLELIREAEIPEKDTEKSPLDKRMEELAKKEWHYPGKTEELPGTEHPAYLAYMSIRKGAVDTVRSIIISASVRMAFLQNSPEVLELLSGDEMDLPALGMGYQGHLQKTALFCIIPDADATYNSIVGMLFTQAFQELYFQADHNTSTGRLPINVGFFQDEFANVCQIYRYTELLSTMRSRGIYVACIIQNLAQIKALYKDTWETIPGNCDTIIYLGGNEASTHEYLSKQLGKWTIEKRSTSESKGKNGSSSQSNDVLGKDLMAQDEIRMLDNRYEIVLIRGEYPVIDRKYQTHKSKAYQEAMRIKDATEKMGVSIITDAQSFGPLNTAEEEYYRKQGAMLQFSLEEFLALPDDLLAEKTQEIDVAAVAEILQEQLRKEREQAEWIRHQQQMARNPTKRRHRPEKKRKKKTVGEAAALVKGDERSKDQSSNQEKNLPSKETIAVAESSMEQADEGTVKTVKEAVQAYDFSKEQVTEAMLGLRHGLSEQDILDFFKPQYSPKRMRSTRELLEWQNGAGDGTYDRFNPE